MLLLSKNHETESLTFTIRSVEIELREMELRHKFEDPTEERRTAYPSEHS